MRDSREITDIIADDFGANATYVEDLLRQYQHNPHSVGDEWGSYFYGLLNGNGSLKFEQSKGITTAAPIVKPAEEAPVKPVPPPAPSTRSDGISGGGDRVEIRGAALKIVENMESSLNVPTATSARRVQVKLLEENRRWINTYREKHGKSKTSFTHFIAWAMIKALEKYPQMNDGYEGIDGKSYRVKRPDVNIGLAVDVQKKDGSRSLLVPNIKGANRMNFDQFLNAYQGIVIKARDNKLQVPDFQGTTLSITNPGTIGTVQSTPRLMLGQGTIIATGAIEYPVEYSAMTDEALSQLGISKIFTITSTYDHRIIQGAESGLYLALIHELLLGKHGFYDSIFEDIGIQYKPLRWAVDVNPLLSGIDRERQEIKKQARVFEFINAYRVRGHLIADIDPLYMVPIHEHPELDAETYGLSIWDLDRKFFTGGVGGVEEATFREIWGMLIRYYCGSIGVESRHITSKEQKQWIREQVERDPEPITAETKKQLLQRLIAAEQFEKFLNTKYLGQKRFSVEGGDSIIAVLEQLIINSAERNVDEVVLGMAHRGRLAVMANIIGNFSERIFTAFEGSVHPNFPADGGDVKYHQGAIASREVGSKEIKLTLSPNPSHLEFVDPVVEGMVRAKQDELYSHGMPREEARDHVLPVLIHGDAAFAGQGIVPETLNLADLKGYRTGGTIHFIINNQIGFTTSPTSSRSSIYSTDVAKMTNLPIFHVNADDVEAAFRVLQIALDFRMTFHKDVIIDLVGFRRHGHNEGDEPSYTQPLMYQRVKEHPGVRELYSRKLIREKTVTREEVDQMIENRWRRYENALLAAKEIVKRKDPITKVPPPIVEIDGSEIIETGISQTTLDLVSKILSVVPQGFTINPKMVGQMSRRAKMGSGELPIDWAFAESLAFGSLLLEDKNVRLSGQDSGRGTFSQRHAVLYDILTGLPWTPLESLCNNGTRFEVLDSSLSESGVLGYEYGYSVIAQDDLTLWEAQFGDFANGAQVIIDQFISPAEDKWQQHSRLVMLLPHGFEGQGPEHSSARLERYLQLCAENNMQVCNPTTPSQYFHLLRRQIHQKRRMPLVVMTPKSLLRLPAAVSPLEQLSHGAFLPVISDQVTPSGVQRILICSGKLYYDLIAEKEKSGLNGRVAILRLEQFYPFPESLLKQLFASYSNAFEVFWVQEEPQNMGGWSFVRPRLEALLNSKMKLKYVGRTASASPATGSYTIHLLEQAEIMRESLTF